MSIEDFLKQMGMQETNDTTSKWRELILPTTVNIILGRKGMGKSALAYHLLEDLGNLHGLQPVVVNLPSSKKYLMPENFIIATLEQVKALQDSITLIDEGTTMLPAGQRKLEELIKSFQALSRQRNQIILLIFHASSDVGTRILRGVDTILLKEPSKRQIEHGSKSAWWYGILTEAKDKFKTIADMGEDKRKFTYVDCEEPEFRGMVPNPLPSFWSEDLSKAWADVDVEQPLEAGQLSLIQREETTVEKLSKLRDLFPDGIVPFEDIIEYDKNFTLAELRKQCADAGVATSGDKKMLAARLIATPQPEILELEGQYSLKELKAMCNQYGVSPTGDKELLIRRLLQAGALEM